MSAVCTADTSAVIALRLYYHRQCKVTEKKVNSQVNYRQNTDKKGVKTT